jgi:hypothetical protein
VSSIAALTTTSSLILGRKLGVPFLAAKSLYLGNGQATHTQFGQGLAYFIEFEWFNDGFNFFHGSSGKDNIGGASIAYLKAALYMHRA